MSQAEEKSLENMPELHESIYKRYAFIVLGHLALFAGFIGLLLPVVPTSPFVLIAAYFYARSSRKFYLLLLHNKYFGENIRQWEESRCIARSIKIISLVVMSLMFLVTIFVVLQDTQVRIWVASLACIALITLMFVPSCERKHKQTK